MVLLVFLLSLSHAFAADRDDLALVKARLTQVLRELHEVNSAKASARGAVITTWLRKKAPIVAAPYEGAKPEQDRLEDEHSRHLRELFPERY